MNEFVKALERAEKLVAEKNVEIEWLPVPLSGSKRSGLCGKLLRWLR
jgi:hypothetical protein